MLESVIAALAGNQFVRFIRWLFRRQSDQRLKAMPYDEKRQYVLASQKAYLESLKPRETWRYRLGRAIGRLTGRP